MSRYELPKSGVGLMSDENNQDIFFFIYLNFVQVQ